MGVVDTLNGRASVLRNFKKLKDWADRSLNMFNNEKQKQGETLSTAPWAEKALPLVPAGKKWAGYQLCQKGSGGL